MTLSDLLLKKYGPKPLSRSFRAPLKSIVERRIINASAEIRKGPNWEDLVDDETERQRWSAMAAEKFGTTPKDMEYIFAELKYYKTLHENCPGDMRLGGADMVWIMDIPDDDCLTKEVQRYAQVLEAHYKRYSELDDDNYLAIIDPALYSLDWELTHLLPTPIESPAAALKVETLGDRPGSFDAWKEVVIEQNRDIEAEDDFYDSCARDYLDSDFSWLPTDIQVNADGSVNIQSYINSLHPVKHSAFYETLSKVLKNTIPLVEQVLTDLVHPASLRVPIVNEECVEFTAPHPEDDTWGEIDSDADDDEVWDAFREGIRYTEPVPAPFVKPDRPLTPYSLRGEKLQVVVEMQNIQLTPDEPEVPSSEWINSGIPTDKIVATSMWYYDVDNAAISDIKFRDPVGEYKELDLISNVLEKKAFSYVYGETYDIGKGYGYEQPAGSNEIRSGRVVCFPNSNQHCKPPVKLVDPTRAGHVKMLLFHFVNPAVRLPSTSVVAPQQQDWWAEKAFAVPPLRDLPGELCHIIQQKVELPMSLEVARKRYNVSLAHSTRYTGESEAYDTYVHTGDILG